MRASALTSREAVLRAIEEHDRLGREAFLQKFGFGRSYRYVVSHEGREYDSKALAGAALTYQYPGEQHIRDGLNGGLAGVVPVLRSLGFSVLDRGGEGDGSEEAEVPEELKRAWAAGDWTQAETDANRETALPQLQAILERFLSRETTLAAFAKESQDFSFEKPFWGFKGYAQMLLNQYSKIAEAAGLVDEAERVLRSTLRAPANDDAARNSFREIVQLTQRFIDEATRLGLGKPALGRIAQMVSYFWEAQDRERWPLAYPASKQVLKQYGLYRESTDVGESYLAFRDALQGLGGELGGGTWAMEHLLWKLRQPKEGGHGKGHGGGKSGHTSGGTALPDVYTAYRDQGLIYPDELVTSFLLSLWTKPFVILTGISGTGKTQIAQGLARALEPGTSERRPAEAAPTVEPGDEEHASFRLTDWALRSGRLYLRADQLAAFDVPERGGSTKISLSLPDGSAGALRLNNIDLSAPRELRLLFADTATTRWLASNSKAGDVLHLELDSTNHARVTISSSGDNTRTARRRLLLPVRADWSDARGLLGFWNPITTVYERTPVIDLLLRANSDAEHPYFLILDEMNLARVEYYFSDFLSAMESGEPIPLYSADDAADEIVPAELTLPPNLFVIGTVNVDETTHAFSPKVLDRASVIEFDTVRVTEALAGASEEEPADGSFRLANPAIDGNDFHRLDPEVRRALQNTLAESHTEYAELLVNLHGLLERYHLHFGYRVIDEITTYVSLAIDRVADSRETLMTAFDLAIRQKVLPKLNGGRELDEPLRRLLAFVIDPEDFAGERWQDAEERWERAEQVRRAQAATPEETIAHPRAASKIARMLRRLAATGFVSFLE